MSTYFDRNVGRPGESGFAARAKPQACTGEESHCEPAAAIARLGGHVDIYRDVCRSLFTDRAGNRARLGRAVEAVNAFELQRAAHDMKGLAGMCGARGVSRVAAALEMQGRTNQLDDAATTLDELDKQVELARIELASYIDAAGG